MEKTIRICQNCGMPMTLDAPAGLCPACLLNSASLTPSANSPESRSHANLAPGNGFGPYRIEKLLGRGGMGEVFEAEHVETGRRVALKVMGRALSSEKDRKRFLREGWLAASVNHPNIVYVHESVEIEGIPVIAMELVRGGTLHDQLKKHGSLPPHEAVEAILQVIDGLEAAHAAGVLHRDIKPANCFVNADGTVKVGDFGLSVTSLARGESLLTATGTVLGTPAYASPEQLRGEEPDAVSDIYSVGASLYHLLTGRVPFPGDDFVKLITEVLDKPAVAPHRIKEDIPQALSDIVLRCLAKDRKDRYPSYAALRHALLPFASTPLQAAPPSRRLLAGLVDDFVAALPGLGMVVVKGAGPEEQLLHQRTLEAFWVWLLCAACFLSYYALSEGRWGAGLGKTLCGLRVVRLDRQPPGLWRAFLRVLVFCAPSVMVGLGLWFLVPPALLDPASPDTFVSVLDAGMEFLLTLCLFVTMRASNGYAALQDLLSSTRVVCRPKSQARPRLESLWPEPANGTKAPPRPALAAAEHLPDRLGPYEVLACLRDNHRERLLLGRDPVLRRQVWIRTFSSEATPAPSFRQSLGRPGRLRWLNGGRFQNNHWEAYEAPEGQALANLPKPAPWAAARFWLLDIAEELSAMAKTPLTETRLVLDQVWLTRQGRAILLDFPCPDLPSTSPDDEGADAGDPAQAQAFLTLAARRVIEGPAQSNRKTAAQTSAPVAALPIQAAHFLARLAQGAFENLEYVVGNLRHLAGLEAVITRPWRAASVSLVPLLATAMTLIILLAVGFDTQREQARLAKLFAGQPAIPALLERHTQLAITEEPGSTEIVSVRTLLANRLQTWLAAGHRWSDAEVRATLTEEQVTLARQIVEAHGTPTPESLQAAEESLSRILDNHQAAAENERREVALTVVFLVWAGVFALWGLTELGGGLLAACSPTFHLFGLAVVDARGQKASRPRLLARWLMVWVPIILTFLGVFSLLALGELGREIAAMTDLRWPLGGRILWGLGGTAALLWAVLIAWTIRRPDRGPQDQMAGTWLVIR